MSEEHPEKQIDSEREEPTESEMQETSETDAVRQVEDKGESRLGRFFKRALRWAVMFLVVLTIGIVAMEFVRVRPLSDERDSLNQSLAEAKATELELQAEIDRLQSVEQENVALSESLLQAEAKLALLNILVDVTRAQLALAQDDPVRVAAALQDTGDRIITLRELIAPTAAADLDGIRERLILVLSEVDADPFAAERDLEILANTLLDIEQQLTGE